MHGYTRPQRRATVVACALAGSLVAGIVVFPLHAPVAVAADPPTTGALIVEESFTGATLDDSSWRGLGNTCLTGAAAGTAPSPTMQNCSASQTGPVPTIGLAPGYLQLTDTRSYTSGTLLYNRSIPADAGLSVEFEQYQYGGTGADGIGFFVVDGSTNLTHAGGTGGSLGYAQRYVAPGIVGGYVGVGLDAFGNFYNDGEGRGTNCPTDQRSPGTSGGASASNAVTLRGPGSGLNGYCFLGSTTDPTTNVNKPTSTLPGTLRAPSGTTDPSLAKRLVNVQITPAPNPRVIVQIDFGTGNGWQEVLNRPAPANTPDTYKFGFTGSTGGVTDVHLLRNVVVRTIEPLSNLQLTAQVDRTGAALPAVITAGTPIPLQYIVTNAGLETVETPAVLDNKVTSITCDAASLPPAPDPAATTICRGVYIVTAADVTAGFVTALSQASAIDPVDAVVTSNSDSVTVPLVSQLSLSKAVTTAGPYLVGQQVGYSYSVTNTGGSTVSSLLVTDNRAGGARVVCDTTNLEPGNAASCTLTTRVLASTLSADGSLVNTALASGVTMIGQAVTSAPALASIQVGTDIRVTKTVSNLSPLVGQTVTFTTTAANIGLANASSVVVSDVLPTGLSFVSSSASAGDYNSSIGRWSIPTLATASSPATLSIVATVTSSRVITNAATLVSLDQPDMNPGNNSASVSLNPIEPTTDIALGLVVDSPSIRVGQTATFTITATNNGPQPATGVTVLHPLPSRLQFVAATGSFDPSTSTWSIGSLAVGESVSVTIEARATSVGALQTVASLTTVAPQDVNQSNDVRTAQLTVTAPLADLQIVKSIVSDTSSISVGDTITYVATVTNAGPDLVPDVMATETQIAGLEFELEDITVSNPSQGTVDLGALTWNIGSLAPGESATFVVRAQVLTAGTKLSVSTVSSATVDDPNQTNNTDSVSFTTGPAQLDLGVTATRSGPSQVAVGQTVSFTVELSNAGPADATDVIVSYPMPLGLNYSSSSASAGSFDAASGLWSLNTLASGENATLTVTVVATQPRAYTTTVVVQSLSQSDTNDANNSAIATVEAALRADIAIMLTATPTIAQPGDIVTYTLTVTNNGPNSAENLQATDPRRDDAILTGFELTQGSFDEQGHVWDVGNLASGETATLTVNRLITGIGTFFNEMVISQSSAPDPDLSNNQTSIVVEVPAADLTVDIAIDLVSPEVGERVTLTISARNLGPDPTGSAVVMSPLPAGLRYVSSVASVGSYDDATGEWGIGDVIVDAPAETLVITAEYTGASPTTLSALISSTSPYDPATSNNSASVSLDVDGTGADRLSLTGASVLPPLSLAALLLLLGLATYLIGTRRSRSHRA